MGNDNKIMQFMEEHVREWVSRMWTYKGTLRCYFNIILL